MEWRNGFIVLLFAGIALSASQNFTSPTDVTSTTVTWNIAEEYDYNGLEIHPGDVFSFTVPKSFQSGIVRNVVLVHRKDDKYDGSVTYNSDGTFWDAQGAYDDVKCLDIKKGYFRSWMAPKFAEPRSASEPEVEILHDWLDYQGIFSTSLITVTNVSPANEPLAVANVHEIQLEVFPIGTVASSQIEIYSPGTSFIDIQKNILEPTYGGGPPAGLSDQELASEGLYPDAIQIGSSSGYQNISKYAYLDYYGRLHVKLPAGKILGGFEVSIGDTKFDKSIPAEDQVNKDGGYGALGWAKLTATLSVSGEYCLNDMNVPPAGVLSGGPKTAGYKIQPDEEIVLSASSYAWVMGYKAVFMKP